MTLTDPREALADQSTFIRYLMGLASLGQRGACAGPRRTVEPTLRPMPTTSSTCCSASLSLGEAVERLAEPARPTRKCGRRRRRPSHERQVAAMTAALASSDFLRAPLLAAAQPDGFKEWHHFVIHGARSPTPDQLQPHQRDVRTGQTPAGAARHRDRPRPAMDGRHRAVRRLRIGRVGRPRRPVDRWQPNDRPARRVPGADRPARAGHQGELNFSVGESAVRRQQSAGGRGPDVVAVRAEAARRRVAAHRWS